MRKSEERKAVLFLAYSADRPKQEAADPGASVNAFSRQRQQLDLFALGTPNAIVCIKPQTRDGIATLRKLQIKHVVDIRDVPYLTFDKLDRTGLFDALDHFFIDPIGMHELMHAEGADSFVLLIQSKLASESSEQDSVQRMLTKCSGNGPTAVFCDGDPKQDHKVGVLLDFLAQRHIKHASLLATEAH